MLFDQTRRFSVGNKKSKKSHKSLDLWDLTVHYLVSSAERAGFEPAKPFRGLHAGVPLQPLEHLSKVLLKPGAKVLIFFDYARVSLANLHRDAMSGCDYLAHPIFIGNRVNSKG